MSPNCSLALLLPSGEFFYIDRSTDLVMGLAVHKIISFYLFRQRCPKFGVKKQFPFETVVNEYQSKGPLDQGDLLKVFGIELTDDLYGVAWNLYLKN